MVTEATGVKEDECCKEEVECNGCRPGYQQKCKVRLFMEGYKYDGCCYVSCDHCGCPEIVIFMRRQDAQALVNACCAEFVEDDEEVECTPCGQCCERELMGLAA